MRIEIENCIIDIDENVTREYYKKGDKLNDCDCADCENFRAYAPNFPDKVKEFFRSLGIDDMRVTRELCPYTHHDGRVLIGGFYHLVGGMTGGNEPQPVPNLRDRLRARLGMKPSRYRDLENDCRSSRVIDIDEGFSVWFCTPCDLKAEVFPDNAVQLEINTSIPWVIDKKRPE